MRNDGKSISEITEDFTSKFNGKNHKEIAFEIYNDIILSKKISKSIIAQQLAHIIDEDLKKKSPEIAVNEDDEQIEYLIEAIKYACRN